MNFLLKVLFKLVSLGIMFAVTMGIGLGLYATTLLPELPTVQEIQQIPLNIPLRIYSQDDKLIAEYGNERRIPVTLDRAPSLLIDAILVTEDDRFYHHTGVDFPGIIRAVVNNLRSKSRAQGASTITMQVARNFFLTPEKTYSRKLKEMLLAFNMERALTKDEILELYLNKIFLGHRSYGFAAAAQVYYGAELENLSVPEIAMLAGLPKAPSRDNPISNPERASQRRDYVLKRLYELGKIDDLSYNTAREAPITATRHVADVEIQAPYIAEMARQLMVERFGDEVYELGYNVTVTINSAHQVQANEALRNGLLSYDQRHGYRGPLDTIDLNAQTEESIDDILLGFQKSRELTPAVVLKTGNREFTALTQDQETVRIDWEQTKWAKEFKNPNSMGAEPTTVSQVVKRGDIVYVSRFGDNTWRLNQMPEVSGALVSLDPGTGAIRALTGGFDYYLSKFNRATQAQRQPGSNIKPFIYSAALENGFTPSSLVSAAPIVVEDDLEGIWRPENYSKKFFGPTRLRKALSLSLNLVSVRLLRSMGIDNTIDHLAQFGFEPDKLPRSLSLALGSTTVTPIDLAAAFAVFANGGKRVRPYLIERIEDGEGNEIDLPPADCTDCTVEAGDEEPVISNAQDIDPAAILESEQVISKQNAFLTSSMMQEVILAGTGRRALALNRADLAGKTGTTNDYRDAWFSGFNPDVITTVFVGFDEPSHLGRRESGASAALPIWVDYMGSVLKDFPEKQLVPPEGITTRFVNKESGKVTSPEDPDGYSEYFMVGTEPNNRIEPTVNNQIQSSKGKTISEALF